MGRWTCSFQRIFLHTTPRQAQSDDYPTNICLLELVNSLTRTENEKIRTQERFPPYPITEYMKSSSFSVGISDLIANKKTTREIIQAIIPSLFSHQFQKARGQKREKREKTILK
jgi:hypothetical protein